jgi:hypothetical protein
MSRVGCRSIIGRVPEASDAGDPENNQQDNKPKESERDKRK